MSNSWSIDVSEGEHVRRGQVIGRVGCTGTCTGPHLHVEVRIDGDPPFGVAKTLANRTPTVLLLACDLRAASSGDGC